MSSTGIVPGISRRLPALWYQRPTAALLYPLLPLAGLFRALVGLRRTLFRRGVIASTCLPVPVVVVGNLTVGGSGKTPLVLWLVENLRARGWRPGIISRGYGGAREGVLAVTAGAEAALVGDEPLLLARRSGVPVFVGRDRVAAAQVLLTDHPDCNVIVSDDGLQHYRLQRTVELAVFDGRAAGNGHLLPAGPLREPVSRLSEVTAVVWNSATLAQMAHLDHLPGVPRFAMRLEAAPFHALSDTRRTCSADDLRGRRLFAMAGIGDPGRFFAQLAALGLEFEAHPFPDHQAYSPTDLAFARNGVLLMTEKDAVKCAAFNLGEAWVLPVAAQIDPASDGRTLLDTLLEKLNGRPLA